MKAKLVKESIEFKRGVGTKRALRLGFEFLNPPWELKYFIEGYYIGYDKNNNVITFYVDPKREEFNFLSPWVRPIEFWKIMSKYPYTDLMGMPSAALQNWHVESVLNNHYVRRIEFLGREWKESWKELVKKVREIDPALKESLEFQRTGDTKRALNLGRRRKAQWVADYVTEGDIGAIIEYLDCGEGCLQNSGYDLIEINAIKSTYDDLKEFIEIGEPLNLPLTQKQVKYIVETRKGRTLYHGGYDGDSIIPVFSYLDFPKLDSIQFGEEELYKPYPKISYK